MSDKVRDQSNKKPPLRTGTGIDFTLDTTSGVPFYRQIIQLVEYHLSAGLLRPGDKLPTIRALSITLKINPNTIAKAYMELEIRGLVTTQVGSGTFVSNKQVDQQTERELIKKKVEELCWNLVRKAGGLGVGKEELLEVLSGLKES